MVDALDWMVGLSTARCPDLIYHGPADCVLAPKNDRSKALITSTKQLHVRRVVEDFQATFLGLLLFRHTTRHEGFLTFAVFDVDHFRFSVVMHARNSVADLSIKELSRKGVGKVSELPTAIVKLQPILLDDCNVDITESVVTLGSELSVVVRPRLWEVLADSGRVSSLRLRFGSLISRSRRGVYQNHAYRPIPGDVTAM